MKQYKAVFIDWDDTIGDFMGAAKRALLEMYDKHNLAEYFTSPDEFISLYKPHNIELWALYGEDKVTKDYLSFDRFFYPLMNGHSARNKTEKLNLDEAISLAKMLSDDFLALTTNYFSLLDGAANLVKYLAEKYPLTVVTNGFVEVQYEKVEKSGLKDFFTHIVLSEEVGYQKPNPRIYEEALKRNALHSEDVVMIGDSWTSDIQGAINANIDQIWVRKSSQPIPQGQTATYIVETLEEIKQIL